MKYRATIIICEKEENGLIKQQTKRVNGSRTAIFNVLNDILVQNQLDIERDLIDVTLVIRKERV